MSISNTDWQMYQYACYNRWQQERLRKIWINSWEIDVEKNKVISKNKKTHSKETKSKNLKQRFLSFLWSLLWKGTLALLAFMFISGIYFDEKIERKLDRPTWKLPAQIYGRPLLLKIGEGSQARLINELKLLNYRPVHSVQNRGQFSLISKRLLFFAGLLISLTDQKVHWK